MEEGKQEGGVQVEERRDQWMAKIYRKQLMRREYRRPVCSLTRVCLGEERNHTEKKARIGKSWVRFERGQDACHKEDDIKHVMPTIAVLTSTSAPYWYYSYLLKLDAQREYIDKQVYL